jgi:hypothetical protein
MTECKCAVCSDNKSLDELHAETREAIERHGWSVIRVLGEPTFMYTIGHYASGLPELLLFGPPDTAFALELLSREMRSRGAAFHHGELVNIGGRLPLKILDAGLEAQSDFTIWVGQFTDDYRVQQVLIPDLNGKYPGEPECLPPYATVPVLYDGH